MYVCLFYTHLRTETDLIDYYLCRVTHLEGMVYFYISKIHSFYSVCLNFLFILRILLWTNSYLVILIIGRRSLTDVCRYSFFLKLRLTTYFFPVRVKVFYLMYTFYLFLFFINWSYYYLISDRLVSGKKCVILIFIDNYQLQLLSYDVLCQCIKRYSSPVSILESFRRLKWHRIKLLVLFYSLYWLTPSLTKRKTKKEGSCVGS